MWAENGQKRADNGGFCAKTTKNDQKTTDERPENGRCSAIVNH
nr:MAG TPA: hypothetical protein [Bacteriophage sp.]